MMARFALLLLFLVKIKGSYAIIFKEMRDSMKKKVVFMGTPEFAAGILKQLLSMDCVEVIGVVSQPDKKVGRKQILTYTAVKEVALKYHLPVFQPISIKQDYQTILDWNPDCIITCAYGQFVPKEILYGFSYPCLNVHASLLPKYRGGAPIHKAIIQGESKTGITLMQMIEKMDAGKMFAQIEVPILLEDTTEILHDRLMEAGCKLLNEKLPAFLNHQLEGIEQDEKEVTIARNISKEEEYIDCHRPVLEVYNHIRGLISWPVGHIVIQDKKIKLWSVALSDLNANASIGALVYYNKKLLLQCLDGCVEIKELQLEGKSRAKAVDFVNGAKKMIEIK